MGLTTLYFAPTAAGTGDGSSAANAAALYSGSTYSSLLANSNVKAVILAGTYSAAPQLTSTFFTTAPTLSAPLFFVGADASGNLLVPPYGWTSDQPAWNASALPVFNPSSVLSNTSHCNFRMLVISGSNSGVLLQNADVIDWCQITNTANNTAAQTITGNPATGIVSNSVLSCTGTSYSSCMVLSNASAMNCRIVGAAGTGGTMYGILSNGFSGTIIAGVTIVGVGGIGISMSGASQNNRIENCTVVNCGGDGISLPSNASPAGLQIVENCAVTGCGGYGINANANALAVVENCRLDRNTSGNVSLTSNYPPDFSSYTTTATDAADYNNAAGGDYRIKSTAGFANRNIGVSQMSSGGSAGGISLARVMGGL